MRISRLAFIALILMACILLFGLTLYLPQSIRLDEAQTLWQINRPPAGILHAVASDVHVPLYHFLNYIWDMFFGNGVEANRLLSLIIFMITVPFVMILANETYHSRKVSIFAAVLFSISPFMNWYANEIRMYTLLTFAAVISQIFFIRARRDNTRGAWTGYILTALFGIYVHYYFLLVLGTQFLFYLIYSRSFPKGSFKKFLLTWLLCLLVLAPWLTYVVKLGQVVNSEPILAAPTLIDVFNTFSEFFIGNQSVPINAFFVALWPLAMIAWFFSLSKNKNQKNCESMYLGLSVIAPVLVAFFVSIAIKPVYLDRYLIFTLPAFYILLAATILSYSPQISRILQVAIVAIMLGGLYVQAVNPDTPTKENYQVAANYLAEYATPQDVIVVSAPFTIYPLEYAYSGSTAIYTLPLWNQEAVGPIPTFNSSTLPSEVQQIAGDHDRLWLLLSYDQGYQSDVQSYFDDHYERLGSYTLSPSMTLLVYRLRYDIPVLGSLPPETSSSAS